MATQHVAGSCHSEYHLPKNIVASPHFFITSPETSHTLWHSQIVTGLISVIDAVGIDVLSFYMNGLRLDFVSKHEIQSAKCRQA